jgi:hypothetical protein
MSKNEKLRYLPRKKYSSLHILKLWSKHKKNNFKFVTIIFFYFIKKDLNLFSLIILWKHLETKTSKKPAINFIVKLVTIIP